MAWYDFVFWVDWVIVSIVIGSLLAIWGLIMLIFHNMPYIGYLWRRKKLGSKAIRIFYVGENKKIDSELTSIGTKDNENVIEYKNKSFIFDPKMMFTLPTNFGIMKKEPCIFYYYNSCYPVDVQSKASKHQPDVLYEVLNAKFHKDFARPKEGVFANLDWKAIVLITGIIVLGMYLISAKYLNAT